MLEAIEAYLSLGAKFTPVELDIDREQLEKDVKTWFRRLKLKVHFDDQEDKRTEEEKRFYTASEWSPPSGKFPPLDYFIFKMEKKLNEWIPPKRIRDNMTPLEREGERLIIEDSKTHVYKMEDKGSCIVRIKKADYERNVEQTLSDTNMYEKVKDDPSKEIEDKVKSFTKKVAASGHINEKTAEYIVNKTKETKPGPYYEQPKTHKFDEKVHNMAEGFPVSCNNSYRIT
jgi:hypothetical protein